MADDSTSNKNSNFRSSLGRFTIPPLVNNRKERSEKWGLPENDTDPGEYIIELNLLYEGGMGLAFRRFQELYKAGAGRGREREAASDVHLQELLQVQHQCEGDSQTRFPG